MSHAIVTAVVRGIFLLTGRQRAIRQVRKCGEKYRKILGGMDEDSLRTPSTVPPMAGIDEDMRDWSVLMLLEHNVLVNRSITSIVVQLAAGLEPAGPGSIDPKTGVMPSPDPGPGVIDGFFSSIDDHVRSVSGLPNLRGTRRKAHPVFGPFDAHQWNCMFGFHLALHLRQAEAIRRQLGDHCPP